MASATLPSTTRADRSNRPPMLGASASAVVLVVLPLILLDWLLTHPAQNVKYRIPFEHFVVVTNVSILAFVVALLLTRSAMEHRQYRVLFSALGFMTLAGFFAVHALTTPGILLPDTASSGYGGYASYSSSGSANGHGSVLGLSAFLSLLIPAIFFALRYTPLTLRLDRRRQFRPGLLVGAVSLFLAVYAALGLEATAVLEAIPLPLPPDAYIAATTTITLLVYSAWQQGRSFLRTGLPMQGAEVAAFLLLADAQVAMLTAPLWTLAWWEYHFLMLVAVILALGALFVELDRRRGLERFLAATVVERVLSGDRLRLGGERQIVTVLFADLRGSTALAEKLTAENVVAVLNSYVGTMARCVFDEDGVLDKFLGDGLMAIFGVPPDSAHGAQAAVRATLAMRRAVRVLNEQRVASGETAIRFGVGIHTGEVVLGAVGLPERADYTAIGDTVNTASRLESLCKQYDVDCVLSIAVAERVASRGHAVRLLGTAAIRGKDEPLDIFTLI